MPNVGGKKYPYTAAGKAAAKKERAKMAKAANTSKRTGVVKKTRRA